MGLFILVVQMYLFFLYPQKNIEEILIFLKLYKNKTILRKDGL